MEKNAKSTEDSKAGGEKFIDSLGQENPAMELEKKTIAEKAAKADKEAKEEEKTAEKPAEHHSDTTKHHPKK